jgi:hypothetical protein
MARDRDHYIVRRALEKDGWGITHDPLKVPAGKRDVEIDLGAEYLIGAEKEGEKIAVEIKTFSGVSQLYDFYRALGQFTFYRLALSKSEPNRTLLLSVSDEVYETFFEEVFIQELLQHEQLKLLSIILNQKQLYNG